MANEALNSQYDGDSFATFMFFGDDICCSVIVL